MSDFKRKIEIVESTTPPPNKYNWWFDLDEYKLKRFDGGEWKEYSVAPDVAVSMPKDNEIWFQLSPDPNISEGEIMDYLEYHLNYNTNDLESYKLSGDVLKYVFKSAIDSLYGVNIRRHIGEYTEIIAVKLPKLSLLGTEMGDSAVTLPTVITQEITETSDGAIDCDNLICLAQTPPEIGDLSYDSEMENGVERVYVKDSVIEKYKSATNWSYLDIKKLSLLDKSVYNWG